MADLLILNGPEIGKNLQIREGVSYLGRSPDNDIRIDSLKKPDGSSDDDLLILLDIAQRVALAVETDRVALNRGKAAEGSRIDVEE